MRIGLSLSPGGLLFPYHVGVLQNLSENGVLNDSTALAGSSAGAIATVSFGCGIPAQTLVDLTIRVSEETAAQGGARGRLLASLERQMEEAIDDEAFERLLDRRGVTGVCYQRIFPNRKAILQTEFDSKDEVVRATARSCMFPFFSTNWPCRVEFSPQFQVTVDGFFAVPRERFGCPDFRMLLEDAHVEDEFSQGSIVGDDVDSIEKPFSTRAEVDRTVTICPLPHDTIGITCSFVSDRISPTLRNENDLANLFRLATQSSSAEDYIELFQRGQSDAEDWFRKFALP